MSKNNNRQHHDGERDVPRELSTQEEEVLSLFAQLAEPDRPHIIRLMQALRDTTR
jgi:hypothetical protein